MRHTTVQANGIDLHLRAMGEPSAPLVLFLHGFPEYSGAWDEVLPAFAGASTPWRPTSAAMRAPPSRRVSRPTASSTSCATSWRSAITLARRPFVLVAHDWGASVAYATAIAAPNRIAKLVVINGVHPGPFQRALVEDEAQRAASTYIHYLRDPKAEAAPVRQQFREAARHAEPLRTAALAHPREARRLSRSLGPPGALTGMLNWYGPRRWWCRKPGEAVDPARSSSSTPRSSGCACRISSSGAWTTARCCP